MRTSTAGAAVLAAGLLVAGSAQAQSYVRADCQGLAPAARYDTAEHERWYRRFWTGGCDRLVLCVPGAPNWNEVVGKLLVRGGPAARAALLPKACRLGQMIGLEWSRERTIRKIDTNDLRVFGAMLEAQGDPLKGLDRVEQATRSKLSSR